MGTKISLITRADWANIPFVDETKKKICKVLMVKKGVINSKVKYDKSGNRNLELNIFMGQRSFAQISGRGGCFYKCFGVSLYFEDVLCQGVFATKSYEKLCFLI